MHTVEVTIIEPRAAAMLDEMESEKLIKVTRSPDNGATRKPLKRGGMKGFVTFIADDFDAPLEDFEEYM